MCVGKIALFGKASISSLAGGALLMCAMWVGFLSSFAGEEKNKINSRKFAPTNQRAKAFLISIYHYRFCLFVCLLTFAHNARSVAESLWWFLKLIQCLTLCLFCRLKIASYVHKSK